MAKADKSDGEIVLTYLQTKAEFLGSEAPKRVQDAATVVQRPTIELLGREGCIPCKVQDEADEVFTLAAELLEGITSSQALEAKVTDLVKRERVTHLLRAIPGILALAPFDINVDRFMLAATADPVNETRAEYVLHSFDLWKARTTKDTTREVLRRLIDPRSNDIEYGIAAGAYAKTFRRIREELGTGDPLLATITKEILRTGEYLPLLSVLPPAELPTEIQGLTAKLSERKDTQLVTDAAQTIPRPIYLAARCGGLESGHITTFYDPTQEREGENTLVYLNGNLVGSIKIFQARTMVALKTTTREDGSNPLVIGGVYHPSKKLMHAAELASEVAGKGRPGILHVDTVEVSPIRFMYSAEGMDRVVENAKALERRRVAIEQNVNNYHRRK